MMMMMKKLTIAGMATLGLACVSSASFAQAVVTATFDPADVATDHIFTATAGNFVVNDFTFALSAGVGMASAENTVSIAVGTASTKGRNAYTGSSNGGSVGACGEPTTGSTIPTVPAPSVDPADAGGCPAA